MSSVTNICNLPTEGNSNAKLLYFFLTLKKTATVGQATMG